MSKKQTGRFSDLPDEEKDRVYAEIDADPAKFWKNAKPATRADLRKFAKVKKKMGRPKVGRGSKVVAISVEGALLARADAFARREGIGRTELFNRGLRLAIGIA